MFNRIMSQLRIDVAKKRKNGKKGDIKEKKFTFLPPPLDRHIRDVVQRAAAFKVTR